MWIVLIIFMAIMAFDTRKVLKEKDTPVTVAFFILCGLGVAALFTAILTPII